MLSPETPQIDASGSQGDAGGPAIRMKLPTDGSSFGGVILQFKSYLREKGYSNPTVKNYLSDLRHFIAWAKGEDPVFNLYSLDQGKLQKYLAYLRETFTDKPSIHLRRASSLKKFLSWAEASYKVPVGTLDKFSSVLVEPTLAKGRTGQSTNVPQVPTRLHQKVLHHIKYTRPAWYQRYHLWNYANTSHYIILFLFISALAGLLFNELVIGPKLNETKLDLSKQIGSVLPAVEPPRILSFQGRLTNASDQPITTATDIRFRIWDQLSGGTEGDCSGFDEDCLWRSATRSVTPDANGVFSVTLGDTGAGDPAIPATLFTDYSELYLGVTAGVDSEMTPRQRIASSSYALNSDALDGIDSLSFLRSDASDSFTGANTLTIADAATFTVDAGTINIGNASGDAIGVNGTSTFNTDVNLVFAGSENLRTTSSVTTDTAVNISEIIATHNIADSTTQRALFIQNADDSAASAGTFESLISLDNADANETITNAIEISNSGAGGTPYTNLFNSPTLDISGAGAITGATGVTSSGTITFSGFTLNGGVIWSNASGVLAQTAVGGAGECLKSNAGGAPSFSACSSGLTPWTSDIDADGFDLTDLSNILFRETTGAPTGTDVSLFRDNAGDLNLNVLTGKSLNIQVNGADEYNFSSTALGFNSNNISGLGTSLAATTSLSISSAGTATIDLPSSGDNIAVTGDLDTSGHGAFGNEGVISATSLLDLDEASIDTSSFLGVAVELSTVAASSQAMTLTGVQSLILDVNNNFANTLILYDGKWSVVTNSAAPTAAYGFRLQAPGDISGSDPVTVYGIQIANQGLAGTTNVYGVRIEDQTAGTNQFAFYQAGTNDYNILAGQTRIGDTTNPTAGIELDVTGDIQASGNLTLSALITDANAVLYTTTAGVLTRVVETETGSQCLLSGAGASGIPIWGSCPGGSMTLQQAYDFGSAGDQVITLDNTQDSIIIRNPSAGTGSDSAFALQVDNIDTALTIADFKSLYVTGAGSFNTTSSSLTNSAGYFSNTSTESGGGNTLTNIGVSIAQVTGGDAQYGLCFDCDGTWSSSTVASGIQFGNDVTNSFGLYRGGNLTLMTSANTIDATGALTLGAAGTATIALPAGGDDIAVTGDVDISGNLALGSTAAINADRSLNIDDINNDGNPSIYGAYVRQQVTSGCCPVNDIWGTYSEVKGSGSVAPDTLIGIEGSINWDDTAAGVIVSGASAVKASAVGSGVGGAGSNLWLFHASNPTGTANTFNDLRGLYIEDLAVTVGGTKHSIFQDGTSATNVLNAATRIGSTSPPTAGIELDVTGDIQASTITLTTSPGLTFSGILATDITTTSNNNLNISPNGSGDVIFTHGDNSLFAINATPTADTGQDSVKITLNPTITGSTNTLQGLVISQSDNANTGVYDSLLKLENLKTPETTTNGLFIEQNSASGAITNAIQIAETAGTINDGILITGTLDNILNSGSIDITGSGAITGATGITSSGTITFSSMITDANAVLYTTTGGVVTRVVETETGSQCLLSGAGASGIPVWNSCPGGSTRLDQILSATATPTALANADFNQTWNWALTTAGKTAFTFGTQNANTGAGNSVNALGIVLTGATPSGGTNTNTGLNISATALASNTFTGINFGSNLTNYITSTASNFSVNSSGNLSAANITATGDILGSASTSQLTIGTGAIDANSFAYITGANQRVRVGDPTKYGQQLIQTAYNDVDTSTDPVGGNAVGLQITSRAANCGACVGIINTLYGLNVDVGNNQTFAYITTASAIRATGIADNTSVDTINLFHAANISGSSAPTNTRGLYIEALTLGSSRYGIYQEGNTATNSNYNILAANTKIGDTATPTAGIELDVAGEEQIITAVTTGNALYIDPGSGVTSGSAIKVSGSGTSAIANGLVQIAHSGAYTGTGGLLNVTGTASTAGTLVNFTNNTAAFTGTGLNLSLTGTTTGTDLLISPGAGVTSGAALQISASGTSAIANGLLQVDHSGAYTSTGGLLNVTATASTAGTLVNFTNNTASFTGTTLTLSATGITSGRAFEISAGNSVTSAGSNTGSFLNIIGPSSGTTLTGIGVEFKSNIGAGGTLQELKPTFIGASGTATGLKFTVTDATTSTGGFNIIDIPDFTSTNITAIKNAINIGNLAASASSTESGIKIGTGWDNSILFATDATHTIKVQDQDTATVAGSDLNITGAAGNTSGNGGSITITSGASGSAASAGSINLVAPQAADFGSGGSGGSISLTTGKGGNVLGIPAGNAGNFNVTFGNGGGASGGTGGTGGRINWTLGNGGLDNTGTSGAGGFFNIKAGNSGTSTGGTGGAAGYITLTGGDGARAAVGGAVTLVGGVGGVTGVGGAISLTTGAGGGTSGNSGALTILTGNPVSGTAGNISIDVGTSTSGNGAVNIGTAARAQTLNIGNATGATLVNIDSGTGGVTIDSTSTGDIVLNSTDTLLLDSAGVLELNSSAGIISIGNDAVAQNINIGTGGAARTITIGNATGGTAVTVDTGTGGLNLSNNNVAKTIAIGNGTDADTINIGTAGSSAAETITLGSTDTDTSVVINSGGTASTINFPEFDVNTDGDILSAFTQLNGSTTTSSGKTSSTALDVTSGTNFDVGNYVRVDRISGNCSGSVDPCYAKITAKPSANTLTISPALSWDSGAAVDEFHIPEVGGNDVASPTLTNRYGRGYFIAGTTTGNGSTTFGDLNIEILDASTFTFTDDAGNILWSLADAGTTGNVLISGNLNVTGTITGPGPASGNSGFWTRTGSTLTTYNAGDTLTIDGGINFNDASADSILIGQSGATDDTVTIAGDISLTDDNWAISATGVGTNLTATDLSCTDCIGPTEISDLTLGTDTAGNYVSSATSLGGLVLSGTEGASLGFDTSTALSGNVDLAANAAIFGQSGLIFEGSTGGAGSNNETFISITDPTADRTITIPDRGGTVSLSGDTLTGDVTATLESDGSTATTVANVSWSALSSYPSACAAGSAVSTLADSPTCTSFYGTIQEEGSSLTLRSILNFVGSSITCADDTTRTTCTLTGGGSQTPWTSDIDADNFSLLDFGPNLTARGAITIASAGAGNDVIINGADILDVQDATTFASTVDITGLTTFTGGITANDASADTFLIGQSGATDDIVTIAGDISLTDDQWSIAATGAVTAVGVNSGAGLLQGALGLTITGAAVSLNASSNFDTNINTGTSTGTVTIGNSASTNIKLGKFTTANGVLYVSATDGTVSETSVNAGATQCLTQASSAAPTWGACGGGGSPFTSSGGIIDYTTATDRLRLQIGQTGDVGLDIKGIAAQTANFLEVSLNNTDANPIFAFDNAGKFNFGPGGASATDTQLFRSAANTISLGTTTTLTAAGTLAVDSDSTNALTVGNGANAKTITIGNQTSTTNLTLQAGSGNINLSPSAGNDVVFSQGAGSNVQLTASAVPTVDQLAISNAGQGVTSAGISGLQITYVGGAAAVEASGARVDLTPGGTTGGTWNGLRIVANATGAASGVLENGIKLEGPSSPGAGTETGMYIGTGWDIGLDVQSGGLNLAAMTDPATPAANNLRVYVKSINGRIMLKAKGPSGVDYAYQPAFFAQAISYQTPLTGATVMSLGQTWTVDTTGSTPAATETFGISTNFATAATANDTAGVSENIVGHYRGSTANATNGFFYISRVGLPDASYGSGATGTRIWVGLSSQTTATMTGNDNPAGDYAGFQYSTNRGDTTWMFITKDNTTQSTPAAATGITFAQNKVYDFYLYTPPQGTTIYWRVTNLTDGQNVEGSTTTNLPRTTIAMRGGSGIQTLTTTARNIRVMKQYVESDQ